MAAENFTVSDMFHDGTDADLLYYLESDASRKKMVGCRYYKQREKIMQAVDPTIAYYLCGIMVVLALIIVIGASRNHRKDKQPQKNQPRNRKADKAFISFVDYEVSCLPAA